MTNTEYAGMCYINPETFLR